ncbi:MAG: hypothetical protein HC841_05090, partial [Verrucomicrobiae bacterium]|nr:hypothetical protein [Verrucomicrobiae bacterium]
RRSTSSWCCALKESNGNRTLAAKKLGISRRTLHRKLHEYHLEGF